MLIVFILSTGSEICSEGAVVELFIFNVRPSILFVEYSFPSFIVKTIGGVCTDRTKGNGGGLKLADLECVICWIKDWGGGEGARVDNWRSRNGMREGGDFQPAGDLYFIFLLNLQWMMFLC
jgi:hypothetical protein